MSSRRPPSQLLVAVLLGVLIGGGLMAITPAGAEVSKAAATSWKKIWKKNLKPLADKRYYTKKQSDTTYATKSESAGGDAASNAATDSKLSGYYKKSESDAKYATRAESDAKYSAAGSGYSKAESDGQYQSKTRLIRGSYAVGGGSPGFVLGGFSFGVTMASAPTVHYINVGAVIPAGCSGSAAAPDALPGHLCVFERNWSNVTNRDILDSEGNWGRADPFGFNPAVPADGKRLRDLCLGYMGSSCSGGRHPGEPCPEHAGRDQPNSHGRSAWTLTRGGSRGPGRPPPTAECGRTDVRREHAGTTLAKVTQERANKTGFDTRAIHAGYEPDAMTGAVNPPIYASSTYKQDGVGGSAAAMNTAARGTRRVQRWRVRSPPWRTASAASRSPPAWPPRTPFSER